MRDKLTYYWVLRYYKTAVQNITEDRVKVRNWLSK